MAVSSDFELKLRNAD